MIKIANWTISCGAREIVLDGTTEIDEIFPVIHQHFAAGLYFFTEVKANKSTEATQADKLVDYIRKNKLGVVTESPAIKKRTTARAWLWVTDQTEMNNHKSQNITNLRAKQIANQIW
jgi:hypothetical protein